MKNKFIKLASISLAIGLACLPTLAASPGSLDPNFGVAGRVITNVFGADRLNDVAIQDDGKIVAVGQSDVTDFTIVRYLVNGSLDPTFSVDGIAFVDFGGSLDSARDVKVQSDGKIIVSGFVDSAAGTVGITGICRFNPNGSLDTSFDTDGKLTISNFAARGLEIQPDGKIVLGGSRFVTGNTDISVARLNSDGTFDSTFDTDGIVTTNGEAEDGGYEIRIQSDGKIVIAGNAVSGIEKSLIVRYNSNGSLDTTFDGDGILLRDLFPGFEVINGLAIDPITNTITTIGTNANNMSIIRYTTTGTLDRSARFGGTFAGGNKVILQSDRKLVCVGNTTGGNAFDDIILVRLNIDLTVDNSFGNNGVANLNDNNGDSPRFAALVGDKLIIGNNFGQDFAIERINLSNNPTQPGDFDGDAFTDSAVYRPTTGNWFILNSSTNTVTSDQFGANGDIPIDGDFDGDGKSDVAVYRPSNGTWFFKRSSDSTITGATFGSATDRPIPGDYDKDGKTDMAFFRPSNGNWFVLRSSTNFSTFFAYPFGQAGDIPLTIGGL